MKNLSKIQLILITTAAIAISLLVYSPHFTNPYPLHIDEWRHISSAINIEKGEYKESPISKLEIGFHIFLLILNKFTNLVLLYKFLPALWAVITSLILFYTTYKLTKNNFQISFLAMLFFGSIKSNVNLLGLWFFTPLTFAIPFIFLYIYFFVQGINLQNKKYIIISLVIMLFLVPIHAISVLFAIPILALFAVVNYKYIKKECKFFSLFILIPITGIIFLNLLAKTSLQQTISQVITMMQFKKGWSPLEVNNSFFEIYSLTAYLLAILGFFTIIKNKKFIPYAIWPIYLLISIFIFRFAEISYLSPYQRNFYYFALSLPLLSAIGANHIISKIKIENSKKKKILTIILILTIIFLSYKSYYQIPQQLQLYTIITEKDYEDLIYLKKFPSSTVLANSFISTAVYPVSQHYPIATIYFHNLKKREDLEIFFSTNDCSIKEQIILQNNVRFIITENEINCPIELNLIKKENNYIYENSKVL